MNQEEINELALVNQTKARAVLAETGITDVWTEAGCRVNLVGSLRMGLLAAHRDIDLHVYSRGVTARFSFDVMSKIACNPDITEIRCINGLYTDEHCIAWHIFYKNADGEVWQIDVIHIEENSEYDGYFEKMADRITAVMTNEQKETILRLKFETYGHADYHGVEYYESVIADGVSSSAELERWVQCHRRKKPYYWIP